MVDHQRPGPDRVTADSVLRWHFVKAGRLKPSDLLSPPFIRMAAKETDEFTTEPTTFIESDGTSLKAALVIARKYGCVPDSVLPFLSGALFQGDVATFYALATQLKIASYINLGHDLGRGSAGSRPRGRSSRGSITTTPG
jgi:hypothetical protein